MKNEEKIDTYIYKLGEKQFILKETDSSKVCRGEEYNFVFDKKTGDFARWGTEIEDDPLFSPIGPEILDFEISVNGCSVGCPFCYKGNVPENPINMTLDKFKIVVDKFPKTLTQIAFGITDLQTNPDFFKMMEYARSIGVIPNFTMTGIDLTDDLAKKIVELCGAVAVSAYQHIKDVGYDIIKTMTDLGLKQTNMHLMVSKQTLPFVLEVIDDIQNDERLKKLNAVVFLGLKPKGRSAKQYSPLDESQFAEICALCLEKEIPFGFDSCSAPRFESYVRSSDFSNDRKQQLLCVSESCESGLFSAYVNVNGDYFPCSFCEGEKEWEDGISIMDSKDFISDVWFHPRVTNWRKKLIQSSCNGCRKCLMFPEIN